MKTKTLRSSAAFLAAVLILAAMLVSCASIRLSEGQTITIRYCVQGEEYAVTELSRGVKFTLPEDPVRDGFSFNGWWVTCEDGVVPFDIKWLKAHSDLSEVTVNARWLDTTYAMEQQTGFMMTSTIQDGAIYGGMIFKFHSDGLCNVFSMETGKRVGGFVLNQADAYKPHCNAVCFSNEFYQEGDEFPLLYANIYNNYNKDEYEDKRAGMVCVYRIFREGAMFKSRLLQVIRVDFAGTEPWRSGWNEEKQSFTDRSPWGNFIIDTDNNKLWAFVTRDENHTTRFFCFDIPKVERTETTAFVKLTEDLVQRTFDIPYSWYLQGACYHDGKIYSTEGMGTDANPTGIRVVDLEHGIEDCLVNLHADDSYRREAEFIDFSDGVCWYGDYKNSNVKLYTITGI
ncbi:MAG: InlB B-repeat-containing protein [Spirochaetales bacterium]|nr:InlB B-repeat-containing protein [Spirochaetales bacterium]